MPKTDANHRPYADEGSLKAEVSVIEADGGFTCLSNGQRCIVHGEKDGRLYIFCKDGKHYLDGQLDDGDAYIGIYKIK